MNVINALEYLDHATSEWPDGIAFQDAEGETSFAELSARARAIGTAVARRVDAKSPVIVFSEKGILTPAIYLGVLAAGCHYIPLDADMPAYRLTLIMEVVRADLLITDGNEPESVRAAAAQSTLLHAGDLLREEADGGLLHERRALTLDTDAACVIFTSGSTGTPKGVVLSHRNIIALTEAFASCFGLGEREVYGNQAPLDYVEGIKDTYLPLRTGARTVFTPKTLFAQPVRLFDYLNAMRVSALCWASPALTLCSKTGVFAERKLETVDKVFFTGSVLHCKHLRLWQDELPGALFVNHYGPTEATASDTYYTVDHIVEPDEELPIGIPFPNVNILLLGEDGKTCAGTQGEARGSGVRGEIAIAGSFVAAGYYRAPDLTERVFVQNPGNDIFMERIYRTGDIGSYAPDGNLLYHGRMDNQIKHMGHRIELSEIESTVIKMPGMSTGVCLYDKEKEQIWLFYVGQPDRKEVAVYLREVLPAHMIPRKFVGLADMPLAFNGKPDMNELRAMMG
ncbi:MAG: AMP-binding protein [Clostridiales Family XIII bacterium]|jgi:amino acid adenylation domain-containing protein|nr:AMP-binding protein [Clostridiales Family XIII bacterium]